MDDAFEGMVEESKYDIKVIKDFVDHRQNFLKMERPCICWTVKL